VEVDLTGGATANGGGTLNTRLAGSAGASDAGSVAGVGVGDDSTSGVGELID